MAACFTFVFVGGFLLLSRRLFELARAAYRNVSGDLAHKVAGASILNWYNFITGLALLLLLLFSLYYPFRPLRALSLTASGDRGSVVAMHEGTLIRLERRSRAALILYGHAAQCGSSLMLRGWVRESMRNSACGLAQAEREIRRAWKTARPAKWKPLRHQKVQTREHAGRVIAALRKAAAQVDANPETGVRELGRMLTQIGDRLAEGRVGALLDEIELEGLEPVRDREALRTVAAAVLVAAAAIAVSFFHLPAEVAGPLTTVTGIIILVTVYRKAARGVETVGLLLGGK
ncbi:hypothetical protein ACWC9R_24875 [Streptomyces sp. NPDC001219]